MRGQSLSIRVNTGTYMRLQRVHKYKYEVLPGTGEHAGKVDWIYQFRVTESNYATNALIGRELLRVLLASYPQSYPRDLCYRVLSVELCFRGS